MSKNQAQRNQFDQSNADNYGRNTVSGALNRGSAALDSGLEAADSVAQTAMSKAQDFLVDTEKTVHDTAQKVGESLEQFVSTNKERMEKAKSTAESTIRTYPLSTAVAAFLGGVIVSALFGKSGR